jgi:hypothetical protein
MYKENNFENIFLYLEGIPCCRRHIRLCIHMSVDSPHTLSLWCTYTFHLYSHWCLVLPRFRHTSALSCSRASLKYNINNVIWCVDLISITIMLTTKELNLKSQTDGFHGLQSFFKICHAYTQTNPPPFMQLKRYLPCLQEPIFGSYSLSSHPSSQTHNLFLKFNTNKRTILQTMFSITLLLHASTLLPSSGSLHQNFIKTYSNIE